MIALCGTAAAKPVWRPPPRPDASELAAHVTAAIRDRDVAGLRAMFAEVVMHDPLWFADAGCMKQLGKAGKLEHAQLRVLAKCLAQLNPIATTRKSALAGGAVLTFAPGIEIEVLFKNDRVQWLGRPKLTAQAFESLRTAGTTQLDSVLATKLTAPASAWVEVCLDDKGVTSKHVVEAKPTSASDAFLAATSDWSFRPFRAPICALVHVTYPAANAPPIEVLPPSSPPMPKVTLYDDLESPYDFSDVTISAAPQNVPPSMLEKLRIRGNAKIEPDAATKTAIAGKTTTAAFKLCVDTSGRVSSVSMLKSSGHPDYDRKLDREMRRWGYKPYLVNGLAVPVCTAVTIIYRP